jgi:hypothetical protein
LVAWCCIRSAETLAAKRRQQPNFSNNKLKEKWIEDSIEKELTVARMAVEDTETAIKHSQDEKRNA